MWKENSANNRVTIPYPFVFLKLKKEYRVYYLDMWCSFIIYVQIGRVSSNFVIHLNIESCIYFDLAAFENINYIYS